jgi:hypothetical protein
MTSIQSWGHSYESHPVHRQPGSTEQVTKAKPEVLEPRVKDETERTRQTVNRWASMAPMQPRGDEFHIGVGRVGLKRSLKIEDL